MKILLAVIAIVLLLVVASWAYFSLGSQQTSEPTPITIPTTQPTAFKEASHTQNPLDTSSSSPTPQSIEEIILESPQEDDIISSPLNITGQARGTWFFEATFPVVLTDWDGRIIAEGFATAQDEWMTEDFVPFKAEVEFDQPDIQVSNRGSLILQKANPSGLPENDDALEITIFFEK